MTATQQVETTAPAVTRWRYVVWLLLGLMIVAHGCHGDEDNELSVPAYRDQDDAVGPHSQASGPHSQASGLGW
jgi:hypothetical protein